MIEIQIRQPAATEAPTMERAAPYPRTRLALTLAGSILVALDVGLRLSGGGDEAIPIIFWGSAAVCFASAFVLYVHDPGSDESRNRRRE